MEPTSQNNSINAIKDARKLFNERRSNLPRKEVNEIRKKLDRKEVVYNFLKEKEQKGSLTNKQKKVLKNIDRYFKNSKKGAFDGSYVLYESRVDKDSKLALYEYFDIIRPYLRDMIDNHQAGGEWKIQLTMRNIFVSFIDANETRVMLTKSDNIEIMSGIGTSDAINELFSSFSKRYHRKD